MVDILKIDDNKNRPASKQACFNGTILLTV